jgi:hypothetical protein
VQSGSYANGAVLVYGGKVWWSGSFQGGALGTLVMDEATGAIYTQFETASPPGAYTIMADGVGFVFVGGLFSVTIGGNTYTNLLRQSDTTGTVVPPS